MTAGGRARRELLRDKRIEVRTYDWLLRAANHVHGLGWGLLETELIDKYGDEDSV